MTPDPVNESDEYRRHKNMTMGYNGGVIEAGSEVLVFLRVDPDVETRLEKVMEVGDQMVAWGVV